MWVSCALGLGSTGAQSGMRSLTELAREMSKAALGTPIRDMWRTTGIGLEKSLVPVQCVGVGECSRLGGTS